MASSTKRGAQDPVKGSRKRLRPVGQDPITPPDTSLEDLSHESDSGAKETKPMPQGNPPVWADKRQSLCEALPYYRSYQGGSYTSGGLIKGTLLDGFPGVRDYIDGNTVIMSLGGGRDTMAGKGSSTGERERTKDQGKSAVYNAAVKTLKVGQYIGVISGAANTNIAVQMPHNYNVLGWYFITELWCEKDQNNFKFWKVKLQRIEEGPAWWLPEGLVGVQDLQSTPPISMACISCHEECKQIFQQGWTCLNEGCARHFEFATGTDKQELQYTADFLSERVPYQGLLLDIESGEREFPPSIMPALPVQSAEESGSEKHLRLGFVCPQCLGCSRRRHWFGWVCETPGCPFVLPSSMEPMGVTDEESQDSYSTARKMVKVHQSIPTAIDAEIMEGYTMTQYLLPDTSKDSSSPSAFVGSVTLFSAQEATKSANNGPTDIWGQLQSHAGNGNWMRLPVRHPGKKHEILTRHFVQNYGAMYKYVVAVASKSFEDAPDPILRALKRMTWAGHRAIELTAKSVEDRRAEDPESTSLSEGLSFDFVPFNELLALGYFEEDKISYHDDGEDTLGPTVATLSLGCSSTMSFRPKTKGKKSSAVLEVALYHGDMVVMHGTAIHRQYEHKVEPQGKRRFALTCRHIDAKTLANDEERRLAAEMGAVPSRAMDESFSYSGN